MIGFIWAVIKWGLIVGVIGALFLVAVMCIHALMLSSEDWD